MNLNFKIGKNGFTLAEMTVVISILSILAAASLPVISKREKMSQSIISGTIIMWAGSGEPGNGFVLCDGTRPGVPDLRDRFIIGNNATFLLNNPGGSSPPGLNITNLPSHTHPGVINNNADHGHTFSIAASAPHSHSINFDTAVHSHTIDIYGAVGYYTPIFVGSMGGNTSINGATPTVDWANHSHTYSLSNTLYSHTHPLGAVPASSLGSHTHTISAAASTTGNTAATIPLNNFPIPPYYVLRYYMKT